MDNSSEALEHSWGTSPKAKAREKEYNHWYYQKHKAEIEAVRKQRSAATNSYKQADKMYNDARRYQAMSDVMGARISGWHSSPAYKVPNGYKRRILTYEYPGTLNASAADRLYNAKNKYTRMSIESDLKSRGLRSQGARQQDLARAEANRILRGLKNPTAKDLAEFYLDTTVEKSKKLAEKAANKAKKYATKAVSNAEKAANKAEKYAPKAISTIEKAANKAERYATKTFKSAANKAKKYAVR
jgi:hypothetical protein